MNVEITQDEKFLVTAVEIRCREKTKEVLKLKKYIENYRAGIVADEDGEKLIVGADKILYIESVDKKTFLYTEDKVLSTEKRLYELEEILDRADFFRCSKSVIVNLNKITRLKPEITRNILATLSNGEVVVVSRRYATELKKKLGIGD